MTLLNATTRRRRLRGYDFEYEMSLRLLKKGWVLEEDNQTYSRIYSKGDLKAESVPQACFMENEIKRKQQEKERLEKIQFLEANGWQKSANQDAWMRPHWEKTDENSMYIAGLNKAYVQQLKLSSVSLD